MKFKIGDKVKILPSAVSIGVHSDEVGKIGVVTSVDKRWSELQVKTDKPSTLRNSTYRRIWYTKPYQVGPVAIVGQQLVFDFMNEVTKSQSD